MTRSHSGNFATVFATILISVLVVVPPPSDASDIEWLDDATYVRLLVHEVGVNQMKPYRGDIRYLVSKWRSRTPGHELNTYQGVNVVVQGPFGSSRMPASFYVLATSFDSRAEVELWEEELRLQMVEDLRSTQAWDRTQDRVDHQYRLLLERRDDLSFESQSTTRQLAGSPAFMTTRLYARPGAGRAMERALAELIRAYRADGDPDPIVVYDVIEGNNGAELLLVTPEETSFRIVPPPDGRVLGLEKYALELRNLRATVMRHDQRISRVDGMAGH